MYPVSSVTSGGAAFVSSPDSGDGVGTNGGIVQGGDLRQVEVTTLSAAVGKEVSTKGKGKAQKSATDLDVLGSLGVVLSSDSARVVEGIFLKADVFARLAYNRMVARQLPSSVGEKLTMTGRAVWYFTYKVMCENNFVSRCIGEYHHKHRPVFIRALPRIQVFSSSSDRSLVPLTGDRLSDFLSRLDCAIHSRVKSVFNSCWSEVSVNLEEESLNAVSCKDFTDVLDVAGIPPFALSAMIAASAGCEINKGTGECTASESIKFSSVGDPGGESSSDTVAAKRHKGGGSVSVPTCAERVIVRAPVWMPPPSSETGFITYSTISPPSACVSLSVQSAYLPGIKLNPDSAKLINNIFNKSLQFVKRSFSQSIFSYILTILNSKLPVIGKAIWFKTYKELHLSKFMSRFICMYHYKHHPNLIRALDSIRVLSSSSDSRLVPLSGVELLDFLSRLDCAIRKEVESIFDLKWNEVADKVFSELEDGLLGDVSCGDFINVLDVVGVPVVAFSTSQRYGYIRPVVSKGKRLGSGSECAVDGTKSRSLSLPEGVCDQSSSKFVKSLFYRDQPGSVSATSAVSTVVTPPEDTRSSLPVSKIASTAVTITTGKGVLHTISKSKGKVLSLKCGTYIDSDVLNSLGVILPPKVVRVIEGVFFKMDVFARRTYKSMVAKQLPSDVSGKLTVTGQAIWYLTYKAMCEDSFLFKCLGKYHYKHRPSFIRSLPSIRVLSDSTDYSTAPLAGDKLLDFLSVLDGAISSKVKSIFNSCWGEVSFSLEEGGLNVVSCKDLIDVLDTAGIPQLASSALIATDAVRERNKGINKCTTSEISVIPPFVLSAMIAASTERERNKGIDDCATPETGVTGLTHSLPSSSQSLSLQSNLGLSPRAYSQSKSQLGSSLPLMEAPGTSPELILPSSIVDSDDGFSSNRCVDLLGVKLHPDGAKLVLQLLHDINKSFRMSFSCSMRDYILESLDSGLSVVGKAIWCKTYREQHLYRFIHRSTCIYHYRYRPSFIRSLDGVRVLSGSSDCRLVPLSGSELLGFLSELDCVVHKTMECMFDSLWNKTTDAVFAELEDGSLSDVSCEDFIRVLDIAGIPIVAFSIYQVHNNKNVQVRAKKRAERHAKRRAKGRVVSEGGTSESSGKRAKDKGSVIDTTNLTHSSVASLSQLQSQPELTFQLQIQPESSLTLVTESIAMPTVSDQSSSLSVQSSSLSVTDTISISAVLPDVESPSVIESVTMPTFSGDSFLIISGDVLVSIAEGADSDLLVVDELSVEPSSSFSPLPAPASDLVVASDIPPHLVVEDELSVEPSSSFSPLPAPASDLVVASDISPPLSPLAKELVATDTVYEFMGAEDGSLSPPSSPSIEPSSSSSSLSLSSSPSSAGLDGDISFSSSCPDSPVSTGEVELTAEGVLSASLGASVGESAPVSSSEQLIVPIPVSSSVSASVSKSSMAASSSSSRYSHGPKKAFIMRSVKEQPFEVPMSRGISAGPSSSTSVDIGSVPLLAAVADTTAEDVGARLAALLNRGLPPSPPPVGESSGSRGGRGGLSSSGRGGAQRSRGRKRKRNS
ncbi:hypothetical protein [Candidatus Ichthyocystis sparus]|uniref:hypothetical protein n=1 Tax=Candidatus Ichthyocystis sparus TaxID=1561004 RepID=UPI000A4370CE|nr:hypothetical protein [Candidatus Ichthyocystis sparus]